MNTNLITPLVLHLIFLLFCFRIRSVTRKCKEYEIYIMQRFYGPHDKTQDKQVLKIRDRCLKECLVWVRSWKWFWVLEYSLTCSDLSVWRQIICGMLTADIQLTTNVQYFHSTWLTPQSITIFYSLSNPFECKPWIQNSSKKTSFEHRICIPNSIVLPI